VASNNLPSITIETFTKIVKMQFQERNFRPIFGLGKGGIGKTESIADLAKKELKIGYIDVRLLLYSETDLKGIPYPNAEHTHTIWLQNNILPNEERDGKSGILVFDEITSCARSVRTAAYQLLNERRLGEYTLPDGWMVVCLGNGEDDGGDFQGMEGNFTNRCSVYNVVPNVESWKTWALKNNVNELVSAYVSFKPQDLHSYTPDSETEMLFASPRSWTAVSNILNTYGYRDGDEIMSARIIGNLGQRVGQQFISFCKFKFNEKTIDPKRILENGEMFKTDSQEIIYITIESVIKLMGDQIKADYQNSKIQENTYKQAANGMRWILGLKKEYAVMGYKDFIRYDEDIMRTFVMTPTFHKFCPELLKFAKDNEAIFS